MSSFNDMMISQIRDANNFDDLSGAFASLFGFFIGDWELYRAKSKKLIELMGKAEALSNIIDKAEVCEDMENISSPMVFMLAGVGPDEFKAQLVEMKPDKPVGALAFDAYMDHGDTSEPELAGIAEKINDVETEIAEIQRSEHKTYDKLLAELREKMGLNDTLAKIETVNAETTEMLRSAYSAFMAGEMSADDYNEQYSKIVSERDAASVPLWAKVEAVTQADIKLQNKIFGNKSAEEKSLLEKREKLLSERKAAVEKFYDDVMAKIKGDSPITEEAAEQWAESQTITPAALKRLKKTGYDIVQFKKDMAEFYRVSGGRVGRVDVVTKGHRRARADIYNSVVYLDSSFDKTTLWHEMGHLLERHRRIKSMANEFIDRRTGRKSGTGIKSLRSITKNKGYNSDEKAWPDDFVDPYVGKYYGDGFTEVLSMGMQCFSAPAKAELLRRRDPEMFRLITGLMLSPVGELEKQLSDQDMRSADSDRAADSAAKAFYSELKKKSANIMTRLGDSYIIQESGGPRKSFLVKMKIGPGEYEMVSALTSELKARMFLYLFLWARQVGGIQSALRNASEIAHSVAMGLIPNNFFEDKLKWEIADIDFSVQS